jgi:hypothetical protein
MMISSLFVPLKRKYDRMLGLTTNMNTVFMILGCEQLACSFSLLVVPLKKK